MKQKFYRGQQIMTFYGKNRKEMENSGIVLKWESKKLQWG